MPSRERDRRRCGHADGERAADAFDDHRVHRERQRAVEARVGAVLRENVADGVTAHAGLRIDGALTFAMNAVIVEGIGRTLAVGTPATATIAFA